ncbi:MAG: glycosyltransferase [Kiritimatiellia bacterium]
MVNHLLPWQFDRANPKDKWSKALQFYFALPGIGRQCRKLGIDFIYWEETLPLGALILQMFFGRRFSIMVMDFFVRIYTEKRPWLHWVRNLIEAIDCWSWKRLPLLFVHVEAAKQFLADRGVDAEKVQVVPNPCNHTIFHPVDQDVRERTRRALGFSDNDIVLTHHGILHPNKGNDWILRCMANLCSDLPNLKFLLIGDGTERRNLEMLAEELGLADQVVFTGWLPSEQALNAALASMDIGLVMRIGQDTDHFHMTDTLNHEMACGKPILAVHLRGIAEFLQDGVNGYLFPVENPELFCGRLRQLASDAGQRLALGAAALETSRSVSAVDICAQRMAESILAAAGVNYVAPSRQ